MGSTKVASLAPAASVRELGAVPPSNTEIRSEAPKIGVRVSAPESARPIQPRFHRWNDNCPAKRALDRNEQTPRPTTPNPVFGLGARFALRFALIAGAFFAVYCFPYAEHGISERWFERYLSAYASMAGGVLSLFEPSVHVTGTNIVGRIPLQIVKNCDAIEINVLFVAAVLAFPGLTSKRLVAAVVGVVLLVVANIIRICSLYYVGIYAPSSFEFFHLELWPLVLVVLAAVNFLLWASWLQRHETPLSTATGK
jgi:exosortase/archaeosortase family protein